LGGRKKISQLNNWKKYGFPVRSPTANYVCIRTDPLRGDERFEKIVARSRRNRQDSPSNQMTLRNRTKRWTGGKPLRGIGTSIER
jgi:hypothetical protein